VLSRRCFKRCQTVAEEGIATAYKISRRLQTTSKGVHMFVATRTRDNQEVVLKVRDKRKSFKNDAEEREWLHTIERQLNLPKMDKVCELHAMMETPDRYYVVMERVRGHDLFEHVMRQGGYLQHVDARNIVRQILLALREMHSAGRVHKDVKLENVMVSGDSCSCDASTEHGVKLIDFDTVEDWQPTSFQSTLVRGTDGYIAPEAYGGEYSPASDMYSAGAVMYRLLTGRVPWSADIFDDLPGENWVGSPAMVRIQERLRTEKVDFGRAPLDRCSEAADLCRTMLHTDQNQRPSASTALQHAWFQVPPNLLTSPSLPFGGSGAGLRFSVLP